MNYFKTFLLLLVLSLLLIFIGRLIGGPGGMVIALILAGVMNFVSYFFSDKIVLAMYKAQQVTETQAPELYRIVRGLCSKSGMPMPKVYIIPTGTPNAFATGRNPEHAAVAATEGILGMLSYEEMEAVMAHELTHVRNRDILISSIAATIAAAIMYLSQMAFLFGGRGDDRERGGANPIVGLVLMILAPIAAMLVQMAISRSREYAADRGAALLTKNPMALASALEKIHRGIKREPLAQGSPATAHMFIANPFEKGWFVNLLSTHPSLQKRVNALEKIKAEMKR